MKASSSKPCQSKTCLQKRCRNGRARRRSQRKLATIMDDEGVGSVVITEGDSPVGIVTDRDLTVRLLAEEADPSERTAEDVMTEDPRQSRRMPGSTRRRT